MPNDRKVVKREDQTRLDMKDVEMVFGSPEAPKTGPASDVVTIANEKKSRDTTNGNSTSEGDSLEQSTQPNQPLLQPDQDRLKPPLLPTTDSGVGDLSASQPSEATPYPDSAHDLLDAHEKDSPPGHDDPEIENAMSGHRGLSVDGDGLHTEDGKWWQTHGGDEPDHPDYPYDGVNGLGTRFGVDDRPGSPMMSTIPDVNTYQQKKNLAQGMMDLALLSANANQLRYVLESSVAHPYYYPSLVFISLSIIFQVAVGIGLIVNSRYNVKDDKDICKADKINNMTVLGVFLITIVNVFITSFSVASPAAAAAVVAAGQGRT